MVSFPLALRLRWCGFLLACALPVGPAGAQTLQAILSDALVNDPLLLEAKAQELGAREAMKATRAGHLPVITMTGNQTLVRQGDNNNPDKRFQPGVKGSLNVFAWGGIQAAVKRDREKERYFHHKYDETREELGNTIGREYLTALRARDSLRAMQKNLERHQKIIHDLEIIVKYDAGRRSELTQAKSRRLQVESGMAQNRRTLDLALSRLARYTAKPIKAEALRGPFAGEQPSALVARYRTADLSATPSYLAQAAELASARANLRVSKAARLPALNLEGQMNRDNKEVFLNFSWNVFDQGARHTVAQNAQSLIAAESRLEQMLREVSEKARTAEVDMRQSHDRAVLTKTQIAAQEQVVKAHELQFKIARRSLIDVLDAYNELSNVELAHINAQNDYRDAALAYLRAQAQIAAWAGVDATPTVTAVATPVLADDNQAADEAPRAPVSAAALAADGPDPLMAFMTKRQSLPTGKIETAAGKTTETASTASSPVPSPLLAPVKAKRQAQKPVLPAVAASAGTEAAPAARNADPLLTMLSDKQSASPPGPASQAAEPTVASARLMPVAPRPVAAPAANTAQMPTPTVPDTRPQPNERLAMPVKPRQAAVVAPKAVDQEQVLQPVLRASEPGETPLLPVATAASLLAAPVPLDPAHAEVPLLPTRVSGSR